MEPRVFEVRTLNFPLLTQHAVEWERGALQYTTSSLKRFHTARVKPADLNWARFWAYTEELGLWEWQPVYLPTTDFTDGTAWSIRIVLGRRYFESIGFNAYPRNGDAHRPSPNFLAFFRRVSELVGGRTMGFEQ